MEPLTILNEKGLFGVDTSRLNWFGNGALVTLAAAWQFGHTFEVRMRRAAILTTLFVLMSFHLAR
jgi:hypothetical protein